MHRGGRPTKLTAAVQERVCDALRHGCHYETAAALADTSVRTLRDWLRSGAQALDKAADGGVLSDRDQTLADILMTCQRAEAQMERNALDEIRRHGEKEWTAHAWRLERRWPEK